MSTLHKNKQVRKSSYKAYMDYRVLGDGLIGSPVLVIGESPGEDECIQGKPFVGRAGVILNNCLERHGIPRESVRVENILQYRPWDNRFENLLNTPILEFGLSKLHEYIQTHRPVVIAALGNYPMHYFTGKGKKAKGSIIGIGNWRGSILPYVDQSGREHEDIKVVPLIHPAAVAREKSIYPIFDIDIKRVAQESKFRGLNYPKRSIIINPTGLELNNVKNKLYKSDFNAIDIETVKKSTHILSISFSPNKDEAYVFSLGNNIENIMVVGQLLNYPTRKIFHFGYFDTTQLQLNGYEIKRDSDSEKLDRLYFFDSYIAAHVLEPELPKTLAYETSVRTRQPYYKSEGKEDIDKKGWGDKVNRDKLYTYNGKDTCTDFEIFENQINDIYNMPKESRNIFDFEMSSMELQCHISNSGMLIDPGRLEIVKQALIIRWAKLQYPIDMIAGREINSNSPKLKDWFYQPEKKGGLGLPARYYKRKATTNDDALVTLIAWCKQKEHESVRPETKRKYRNKLNIVRGIREIRGIRQRLSMYIDSTFNEDGRTRSTYKWGPETGRWAASKYHDGTGYNHQTNPRDPIEVSDEDFEKYKNEYKLVEILDSSDRIIEDESEDEEE